MNVSAIRPILTAESKRKIAAALGIIESSMDVQGLLERAALMLSGRVTPLKFQYELVMRAKQQRRHVVLPEGCGSTGSSGPQRSSCSRDVCDITLLGDPEEILQKAASLGLSLDRAKIVDPRTSELLPDFADAYYELRKHKGISQEMARDTMMDSSYFGTMMVHRGLADGMVSGSVHTTAHTIRPALEFVKTKTGDLDRIKCFFHVSQRPRNGLRRLRDRPRTYCGAACRYCDQLGRHRAYLRN